MALDPKNSSQKIILLIYQSKISKKCDGDHKFTEQTVALN